jgi:hypothetical protein
MGTKPLEVEDNYSLDVIMHLACFENFTIVALMVLNPVTRLA